MATVESVHIARRVRAAIAPGSKLEVDIDVTNLGPSDIEIELVEITPPTHKVASAPPKTRLKLAKGGDARLTWILLAPATEGPALLRGAVMVRRGDSIGRLEYETPIATYAPHPIERPEQLIEIQQRLVTVTNFHRRNGHLLAMDAVRYFEEHLNVPLAAPVKQAIAAEFAFSDAGLPASKADFEGVKIEDRHGLQFIEDITLEPFGDQPDDHCDEMLDRTYTREYPGVRT